MQEEFELTYLAKRFPESFSTDIPSKEILDIYIPTTSSHATLRIRKRGEVYEITKKTPVSGTDSSHQNENTIPLTKDEFDEFATLQGKRVRKIRYYYDEDAVHYEIDIFQDALSGLVLIDIEFTSNEEKAKFVPPAWVLADVTQEKAFAGGVLCGKTYADIQESLDKYKYEPLSI